MRQEFRFTLPVYLAFDHPEEIDPVKVQGEFKNLLSYQSDGRGNLERECMDRDLTSLAILAVRNVLYRQARDKYGNEMVEVAPKSSTARAVLETEKSEKLIKYCGASLDLEGD